MLARYEQAMQDPELLSISHDVALLQSLIQDRMAAWAADESGPDWDAVVNLAEAISENWKTWDHARMQRELRELVDTVGQQRSEATILAEIRDLMDQRAKLAAREHKRLLDLNQMMTVEQAILVAQTIAAIVNKHVSDLETKRAINAEISAVFGDGSDKN